MLAGRVQIASRSRCLRVALQGVSAARGVFDATQIKHEGRDGARWPAVPVGVWEEVAPGAGRGFWGHGVVVSLWGREGLVLGLALLLGLSVCLGEISIILAWMSARGVGGDVRMEKPAGLLC